MNVLPALPSLKPNPTRQRRAQLVYEGENYTQHRLGKQRINWRCAKRTCSASISTNLLSEEVVTHKGHDHPPSDVRTHLKVLRRTMIASALTTDSGPSNIYMTHQQGIPEDVSREMPIKPTVQRNLRKYRSHKNPPAPQDLVTFEIPPEWTTTSDGRRFLLKDDICDVTRSRCIIFSSDAQLRLFSTASDLGFDGTFDKAPELFQQLYVIHVPLGDTHVPVAYVMMSSKRQDMYEMVLTDLKVI